MVILSIGIFSSFDAFYLLKIDNENKTPVILDGKFFEVVIVKNEIVKAICMIIYYVRNRRIKKKTISGFLKHTTNFRTHMKASFNFFS